MTELSYPDVLVVLKDRPPLAAHAPCLALAATALGHAVALYLAVDVTALLGPQMPEALG